MAGAEAGMSAPEDIPYGLDLADADPASLGAALGTVALELVRQPPRALQAATELAFEQSAVALSTARRLLGADDETAPAPGDARFADRAWAENPLLRGLLESYLVAAGWSRRVVETLELPERTRSKARFALGTMLDALAPSNLPFVNPEVAKEAIDTGGLSVARGLAHFVEDALSNGGLPRHVEPDAFAVGRNLAATPGRVVLRNDLIELIAYEPQTAQVFEQPLVYSPPWINKYYLLDLSPGRSFVEHAVANGHLVFAISYRNPDASMASLTLDDYLRDGLFAALDRAVEISGSERVGLLGVCVGGTLAAIGTAVLAARGEAERIASLTLLNTLVDYSDPGEIGVFVDEAAIRRIEARMSRRGFLSEGELSGPFTWMRGNDLVWRYVVSSWYLGRRAPAFDLLAWNGDSTRLPAAMHSQFLRTCYLRNLLPTPDAVEIDGTPVDLGRIECPLYVLGAEADHITPWRGSYSTTQLAGGDARYVLTNSGHIAGIVRPPGTKRASYWIRDGVAGPPDEWLAGAEHVDGSWWDDWTGWAEPRFGARASAPDLPAGDPAPGSYVLG